MFDPFRHRFPLTDNQWEDYTGCFHRMQAPAHTILLKEGETPNKLFLVEKGAIRVWFNNDGKDITFRFFFENQPVASIESFKKNRPSPVTIETIEPCTLWYMHKKDVNRIMKEISEVPALREMLIDAVFERTFDYMKHFLSFIKDTPAQRYLQLLQDNPQVIRRVPQHYIASWLGISPVHLSRIKSRLAREHRI